MWKRKLLQDLFLPTALIATSILEACTGGSVATPTVTPSTVSPSPTQTTSTPNIQQTKQPAITNNPTTIPTEKSAPPSTATPTPKPTPAPSPTEKPVYARSHVDVQDARKIKSEITDHLNKEALAIYLPWFGKSKWSDWSHWEWTGSMPHDPRKLNASGQRDIASVYYPMIGTYDSSDANLIKYHMDLAKKAGLDGFVVDWYGHEDLKSTDLAYMDSNFSKMLNIADSENFQLGLMYEPKIHFNGWIPHPSRAESVKAVEQDLRYAIKNYGDRKSLFSVVGVPVIFLFEASRMTPEEWSTVMNDLENENLSAILVGDNKDPKFFGPLSGEAEWIDYDGIVKSKSQQNMYQFEDQTLNAIEKNTTGKNDRFAASYVYPGFNDTGVWGWGDGPRVLDRRGGKFYQETWQASLDNKTSWVIVATWNDFNEGTNIEPDTTNGYAALDMTADFIARFKGIDINHAAFQEITNAYIASR